MGSEIAGLGGLTGGGFDPGITDDITGGFDTDPGSGAMMDSGSDPDYTGMSGTSTTTTPAPATSTINDSTLVEMMLSEETPIIDEESRNNFSFDELDFIDSSIPPNKYAYATTYYTTFYVRNYSYNWNANSYLSVDINGKVTDIYADTYETIRMDYYPPEAPAENVVDVIKFHVDEQTTKNYKTFERGNYVVLESNDTNVTPTTNQPYCVDGLLYTQPLPGENDPHHNLAYATVSKNLKFILDPSTSNDEINTIREWWLSSYFTYVANIWDCTGADTQGSSLTNNYSIPLDNIPDATNDYVLICGQFTVEGENIQYTITVVSDNNEMGSVTGSGTFDYLSIQTITATPAEHYHFTHWNDDDINATRTIQVLNDYTFTAYFEQNAQYTINVTSNDATYGSVTGDGEYYEGETVTLMATPNTGYEFDKWTKNDVEVSTSATYEFNINVENAGNYTAYFKLKTYEITTKADPAEGGNVSGGGTYSNGTEVTLTATPNDGYHFVQWNDGNTDNPRTITVTGDAGYEAKFEAESATN